MIHLPILRVGQRERFPPVEHALIEPNGLLAVGGDLSVERLLDAYSLGIFPWFSPSQPILWWSPDPRIVFDTDRIHVAARFARWLHKCRWHIRADSAFGDVMLGCAEHREGQDGTWIGREMRIAYERLHDRGYAHSVEVWDGLSLVGGIYGVAIGQMFFGESMFSRTSNASKVALLALCHVLQALEVPLLDAQVASSHLLSLGAYEMPRTLFCARVAQLTRLPATPARWSALTFPDPVDLGQTADRLTSAHANPR
ncbi:MAG: leucyl/phenylalanyl-tRNA--protein transferase [Rhodanobacteraceae bacterium]